MAKTFSYVYINDEQLMQFIEQHSLSVYPNVLVQIFTGSADVKAIEILTASLKYHIPNGLIVGCTTAGEIYEGEMCKESTVITFTAFEKTGLKLLLTESSGHANSFEMGQYICRKLTSFDTKAMVLLGAGYEMDADELLEGISDSFPELILAGALAGNSGTKPPLVFSDNKIIENGVAAVSFQSDSFYAVAHVNSHWQEVGKTFTITEADGNNIYSIDGKKPLQIIKQYLGDDFLENMKNSRLEFPFLLEKNGEKLPLFIAKQLENGAIQVTGKVKNGQQMTFAYTNQDENIKTSIKSLKELAKTSPESIFIYNCVAMKVLASDFTESKLKMMQRIAPVNGFLSFGELVKNKNEQPKFTGQSIVYFAFSENKSEKNKQLDTRFTFCKTDQVRMMNTLTHLTNASQLELKKLNNNLIVSEQYYKSLFDHNPDIVYSLDLKGNFTSVNIAFEKNFGFTKEELIGKSALKFIYKRDVPFVSQYFNRVIKGQEQLFNVNISLKNNEENLYQIKNIPIKVNEQIVGIYGIGKNMTEIKKIEDKVTELSYYDPLTGLPNRVKFLDTLQIMLAKAKKKKRKLAVLSIDIDRFKFINDGFGHYAGDLILKELSKRIESVLPMGAFLGSFGGDKYTLILSKNVNVENVMKQAKVILNEVEKPSYFEGREFFVTASIGVSLCPSDTGKMQELIKNADIAMNRSKQQGGNRITFFSTDMNSHAKARLELESYLRKALSKEEFHLCYQPQLDLNTGRIYGSEALIRWNHPLLGVVSPADFIPLAEETGLIVEIGKWVLHTACEQNKKWQNEGLAHLIISVNVSAQQFQQPDFVQEVDAALRVSGMEAKYLTLELTESTMLQDVDYSISVMNALKEIGVKVSLDDFGTGYSSLSYLKNLPINILKIDRSFIDNLKLGTSDIAIVQAIITMGQGLGLKVVAEGVETKEQIEMLKTLKCHYGQGFFIQKPLLSSEFIKGIKNA